VGERISLVAYAEDCLVQSELELDESRLSDHLNSIDQLVLDHVTLTDLATGEAVAATGFALQVEELLAVEASGWRGPREKRIRTREQRTELAIGPYRVLGRLHATPGADAVASLRVRPMMVPLTETTIAFTLNGTTVIRDVPTLIVNRLAIHSLGPSTSASGWELSLPSVVQQRASTSEIYAFR